MFDKVTILNKGMFYNIQHNILPVSIPFNLRTSNYFNINRYLQNWANKSKYFSSRLQSKDWFVQFNLL